MCIINNKIFILVIVIFTLVYTILHFKFYFNDFQKWTGKFREYAELPIDQHIIEIYINPNQSHRTLKIQSTLIFRVIVALYANEISGMTQNVEIYMIKSTAQ